MSNLSKKFLVRDVELVKKDLDIARKQYGSNIRRIFFLDGNAMVTPTEKLLDVTRYANQLFPNLERCGVYAHSRDILKKSDEQLKMLSEAGLKIAYVGFESGSDHLLERVKKQVSKSDHIKASKKLMKAGITLSATLINGLGNGNNPEISKEHALESADLVNKICPDDDRAAPECKVAQRRPPVEDCSSKDVIGGIPPSCFHLYPYCNLSCFPRVSVGNQVLINLIPLLDKSSEGISSG